MARHLDSVVALQQALDTLSELEESLAGVPPEMRELHDEYTERKSEIEALEAVIQEAESERRASETGTQDCEEKLKHYQDQVNRVRTQREYSAILQEIDTARAEVRAFEEQALAAMVRQEEAESELGELRAAFQDLDQRYGVEAERWEAAKPGVAERAEGLRVSIAELRDGLPPGKLLIFERLYERTDGHALATIMPVDRGGVKAPNMWHCGFCNYNVRPQAVVEILNHGSLLHCDSCKRLLFIEESEI